MKKKDAVLGFSMILLAVFVLIAVGYAEHSDGNFAMITVNGSVYGTYSLDEDQEIEVKQGNNHNKICIMNGEVYMKEADCPDGYCMNQGKIKNSRQTIVCLPHKLVVEIIENKENNQTEVDNIPDAVAN